MLIHVKTLSNEIRNFNFEPSDTINQVKVTLQESIGVDVAMIKLVYKGQQLMDEQTIEKYKIAAGDTLIMIL